MNFPLTIKIIGESKENTIIDGESAESVFHFNDLYNNEGDSKGVIVMKNFTIQNGDGTPYGGGIDAREIEINLENIIILFSPDSSSVVLRYSIIAAIFVPHRIVVSCVSCAAGCDGTIILKSFFFNFSLQKGQSIWCLVCPNI